MILDKIVAHKRIEVEERKARLRGFGELPTDTRDFASAIRRPDGAMPRVISEVKKASPSKGVIRADFEPISIATRYEQCGASALSVLTDEEFFQGKLEYLTQCRNSTSLPALRKDFVIDEFQITEARAAGSDAVLLIAALLDTETLKKFREYAALLGMASLVEVHDESELESALTSGAEIVGINNRNLQTFEVSLETTFRLLSRIPQSKIVVSESGISTCEDMKRLADAGVDAALVGESLMRRQDPGEKLLELIGR